MGKLAIDPNILRWWEETKKLPLPEKLDDAALEFEMMLEAHEETFRQRLDEKFKEMFSEHRSQTQSD